MFCEWVRSVPVAYVKRPLVVWSHGFRNLWFYLMYLTWRDRMSKLLSDLGFITENRDLRIPPLLGLCIGQMRHHGFNHSFPSHRPWVRNVQLPCPVLTNLVFSARTLSTSCVGCATPPPPSEPFFGSQGVPGFPSCSPGDLLLSLAGWGNLGDFYSGFLGHLSSLLDEPFLTESCAPAQWVTMALEWRPGLSSVSFLKCFIYQPRAPRPPWMLFHWNSAHSWLTSFL